MQVFKCGLIYGCPLQLEATDIRDHCGVLRTFCEFVATTPAGKTYRVPVHPPPIARSGEPDVMNMTVPIDQRPAEEIAKNRSDMLAQAFRVMLREEGYK